MSDLSKRYPSLEALENKTIVILGFGMEGQSSFRFLQEHIPTAHIQIMDMNSDYVKQQLVDVESINPVKVYSCEAYLDFDDEVDIIFKSPGIPLMHVLPKAKGRLITSQSQEFIQAVRERVIGITGSKGKSTTASMLAQLLKAADIPSMLVGNIGITVLDQLASDDGERYYVYELSSHQLEPMTVSPKYGVVLNIFEEHLDHYLSYRHYALAKLNMAAFQEEGDVFIYGALDDTIDVLMKDMTTHGSALAVRTDDQGIIQVFEDQVIINMKPPLAIDPSWMGEIKGLHNRMNLAIALYIKQLLGGPIDDKDKEVAKAMKHLPHRLAEVGCYKGITFYDDSISTIPQATIAAIKALEKVGTVIFGGMDRGIDYHLLESYISNHPEILWIGLPASGHSIIERLGEPEWTKKAENLEKAVQLGYEHTKKGMICILSPAAASYGYYKNFVERGEAYEKFIRDFSGGK